MQEATVHPLIVPLEDKSVPIESLDRAKAGMSRVYQGRAIVHEQSVRELATNSTI